MGGLALTASLVVAACAPRRQDTIPTRPPPATLAAPTAVPDLIAALTQVPTGSVASGQSAAVVFVKDGDIQVWDEASGESQTIFDSGDVIRVELSDDGEVVAFLRRSIIGDLDSEWHEQSALWAVGRNGENPRELVSAEDLRELLHAAETDSTNIPQLEWIPRTHRLLFSRWTYFVQAEGESHATPGGLYLVDADTLAQTVLLPADNNVRFVPSPDGLQIALMSLDGLGFINVDGSNLRQDLLTYPPAGLTGPIFPTGVWTRDSQAFLITGSLEWDPIAGLNFAIWLVSVDGSSPESLAAIRQSDPSSVTFSPDGQLMAFVQYTDQQPPEIAGWFTTPLTAGPGPLAIPHEIEVGPASLHWSPAGDAFTGTLMTLCPGPTRDSEVCDSAISFWGSVAAIRWMDGTRFLLLTRDPSVLFLVTLDVSGRFDATTVPIVAWPLEEWVGPQSFAAVELGH